VCDRLGCEPSVYERERGEREGGGGREREKERERTRERARESPVCMGMSHCMGKSHILQCTYLFSQFSFVRSFVSLTCL